MYKLFQEDAPIPSIEERSLADTVTRSLDKTFFRVNNILFTINPVDLNQAITPQELSQRLDDTITEEIRNLFEQLGDVKKQEIPTKIMAELLGKFVRILMIPLIKNENLWWEEINKTKQKVFFWFINKLIHKYSSFYILFEYSYSIFFDEKSWAPEFISHLWHRLNFLIPLKNGNEFDLDSLDSKSLWLHLDSDINQFWVKLCNNELMIDRVYFSLDDWILTWVKKSPIYKRNWTKSGVQIVDLRKDTSPQLVYGIDIVGLNNSSIFFEVNGWYVLNGDTFNGLSWSVSGVNFSLNNNVWTAQFSPDNKLLSLTAFGDYELLWEFNWVHVNWYSFVKFNSDWSINEEDSKRYTNPQWN